LSTGFMATTGIIIIAIAVIVIIIYVAVHLSRRQKNIQRTKV
jgi:uncharacterized protein YoxC